jgi:hypothetical protein
VPSDAPVLEKSAAPNSTSSTLRVNTVNTVNGTDSVNVGTSDTRATNAGNSVLRDHSCQFKPTRSTLRR